MKTFAQSLAIVATLAGAASLAPASALAAGPGGHGFGGGGHSFSGGHSFAGGGWHGGRPGGSWRGGHRGFWPGPFWGGIGLGLGIGAIGYYGAYPYYGGYPYSGGYPYYGYYYDAPEVIVSPAYTTVEPAGGVRSGQAVPQASRAPDPIYYPKDGQSAATVETDRRECNRWATTQPGAMADASIFQRATFACMEGRGYTVK